MKRMLMIGVVGILLQPLMVLAQQSLAQQIAAAVSTGVGSVFGQSLSAADQKSNNDAIASLKSLTPAATTPKVAPTAEELAGAQGSAIQTLSATLKSGTPVTAFTADQIPVAPVNGKIGGITVTRPNDASSWADDKAAALDVAKQNELKKRTEQADAIKGRADISMAASETAISTRKTSAEETLKAKTDTNNAALATNKATVELGNATLKVTNDALIAKKEPIPNNYNAAFFAALAENKTRVAAGLAPNPIDTSNFYKAPPRKPRNRANGFN